MNPLDCQEQVVQPLAAQLQQRVAIAVAGDAVAGEHVAHHRLDRIRRATSCAGAGHRGILAGMKGGGTCRREDHHPPMVVPHQSASPAAVPTMQPVKAGQIVRTYSAVIERCSETGLLVGHVPGFPGAHSQGATLDELQANLQEVIAILQEDGEPSLESNFVGLQQIVVPA